MYVYSHIYNIIFEKTVKVSENFLDLNVIKKSFCYYQLEGFNSFLR